MNSIKETVKWSVFAFAAFCAFCILIAECSDDENESNKQAQTAQKVETKKQSEVEETKKVEEKKDDGIVGIYEATDKIGNKLIVTLKSDKTATVKELGGEGHTFYCTWRKWSSVGIEIHSPDEPIELVFEAGVRSHFWIYIKDGWLYSYNGVETNNPTLRLKVTKTQ